MAVLQIIATVVGQQYLTPRPVFVLTNDILSKVISTNYLTAALNAEGITLKSSDLLYVSYGTNSQTTGIFTPTITATTITLTPFVDLANVTLPVTSGHFANFSGTTGLIADLGYLPSNAAKTIVSMVSAAVLTNHIACFSDTTGTINDDAAIAINGGDLQAGLNAVAGKLRSYSATTTTGYLEVYATANSGAFNTGITNSAMGQSSVISVPDPGAATANFLLDTGTANIVTDYQQFVGLTNILINSVGTWTRTRVAEANYSLVHTPADDTSVIGIDILPQLRAAANKGFKLASIDVIYSIATLALDAHTFTLDSVSYANNVAVSVTLAGSGSLSTATQANPYVTNVQPITPAFINTACTKYVFELTVNAAATSVYSFYGLNLHFSKTIS
jgi:hypothetical protein